MRSSRSTGHLWEYFGVAIDIGPTNWFTSTRLARLRRILLGLYLFAAFADATAKMLVTNETLNRAFSRVLPPRAAKVVQGERQPGGNFEIFRAASRHLVRGEDLYAFRPAELRDRFKYSPTFALLFAPLAWLPWPLALFLWNALNALLLFASIDRLLPRGPAVFSQACLFPEVLRSMQNAQSNALVAALIILTFVALERGRTWRAATTALLGACIKIFPLAALTFAIPRRKTLQVALAAPLVGLVLLLAPLLVTGPATLLAQYRSWGGTEALDAQQRWFSVMELLHRAFGADWPSWSVQVAGVVVLLAPLALRRARWADAGFRTLYLCSVLLFVCLFNHQAERSSYLIAFTGSTIWFAVGVRTLPRSILYTVALLSIPLMSTLLPVPDAFRSPTAMLFRLAIPTLAIWIAIQRDLLKRSAAPA
jgi:hypothetical protein